jgi:haloalkane dehalogenase
MTESGKQLIEIDGYAMAYVAAGDGAPIVFLHGNPTSSWLWRNILPGIARAHRCIAPDLIGMGDSARLSDPADYSFARHAQFVDGFLDAVVPDEQITLVLHDWGSGLGFDWATRHPDRVRGIAYMEAIVRPLIWAEWPAASRELFQALRSPVGEKLILEKNLFVENILPASIQRTLSDAEMAEYRRPFAEAGAARTPTLAWPRQLPIDNEPPEVCARVQAYAEWLSQSDIPKLFINAEPGAILVGAQREFCRSWPNQAEVTVPGIHFIQEDAAQEITAALANWLSAI